MPQTQGEIRELLEGTGLSDTGQLFSVIPDSLKKKSPPEYGAPLTEWEVKSLVDQLARNNFTGTGFIGYGYYSHLIPEIVDHVGANRNFVTSYTPYQPEVAQGTLQALFEYQSQMAALTGMDIANASMYDASTALIETIRMVIRERKDKSKKKIYLSKGLHHQFFPVLDTYFYEKICDDLGVEFVPLGLDPKTGKTDYRSIVEETGVMVVIQSPNVYGVVETPEECRELYPELPVVMGNLDPLSLSVIPSPSESGVDVVWGEAQGLGIPVGFGGPALGYIAARKKYMRQMPGRLIGQTGALDGEEQTQAYLITLSTREQHIRREKATSNICSNQSLMALRASAFMASIGWEGMQGIALQCMSNADYFIREATKRGITVLYPDATRFHEVAWKPASTTLDEYFVDRLVAKGVHPGKIVVLDDGPAVISYFSENTTTKQIDNLIDMISSG